MQCRVAEHERPFNQRRVQDDLRPELGRSGSRSRCSAWLPPDSPRRSRTTSANSISITRFSCQHLAAAQDAHHGGAQQHVHVAALVHRRPRVVHLVEALHGLVLVVLAALQQVMHGHGAAVVVNVVALAVGEDLHPLGPAPAGWRRPCF